jgi:hypothetical protein
MMMITREALFDESEQGSQLNCTAGRTHLEGVEGCCQVKEKNNNDGGLGENAKNGQIQKERCYIGKYYFYDDVDRYGMVWYGTIPYLLGVGVGTHKSHNILTY